MSINGIEAQYQNYAGAGASRTKSNNSKSMSDSFQNQIMNWGKRIKEAIDKEQENDSNGSIMMSEKKWQNLMKKVDYAIDTKKDNKSEQEQEEKKQLEDKNLIQKDMIAIGLKKHKNNI